MSDILMQTSADLPFFTSQAGTAVFYLCMCIVGLLVIIMVLVGYIAHKVADNADTIWRKKRRKEELKAVVAEAIREERERTTGA